MKDSEGGHDWFHIERVYKNALLISKDEVCNEIVVQLGALLHDIADSKFHNGDETIGPRLAREFLEAENGEDALTVMGSTSLRFVLMDVEMPKMKGTEATQKYRTRFPDSSLVIIANSTIELTPESTIVFNCANVYLVSVTVTAAANTVFPFNAA